jgi:hypothetical protein
MNGLDVVVLILFLFVLIPMMIMGERESRVDNLLTRLFLICFSVAAGLAIGRHTNRPSPFYGMVILVPTYMIIFFFTPWYKKRRQRKVGEHR